MAAAEPRQLGRARVDPSRPARLRSDRPARPGRRLPIVERSWGRSPGCACCTCNAISAPTAGAGAARGGGGGAGFLRRRRSRRLAIFAAELGPGGSARFVQADVYDAPRAIPEPAAFDRVFVPWGDHLAARHKRVGEHRRAFPEAGRRASILPTASGCAGLRRLAAGADGRPGFGLPISAARRWS